MLSFGKRNLYIKYTFFQGLKPFAGSLPGNSSECEHLILNAIISLRSTVWTGQDKAVTCRRMAQAELRVPI